MSTNAIIVSSVAPFLTTAGLALYVRVYNTTREQVSTWVCVATSLALLGLYWLFPFSGNATYLAIGMSFLPFFVLSLLPRRQAQKLVAFVRSGVPVD